MNQEVMRIVMGVLTSLMATFAGCPSMGCATLPQIAKIAAVSEKPVFVLEGFGVKITVHALEITFFDPEGPNLPVP